MKFAISEDSFAEIIPDDFKIRDVVVSTAKDLEKQGKDDSFFLGDVGDIYKKFAQFQRCLPNVHPFYSVKTNDSPGVLKILDKLGLGFDCCSEDEMKAVFDIGVTSDRIIYAHTCKQISHLRFALAKNVSLMTFDNSDELYKIKNIYPNAELVIRLQVDDSDSICPLGSKFGVAKTETKRLLILARSLGLSVVGVSFHVGYGCHNPLAYYNAVKSARNVFDEAESIGFKFTILDVGGGLPGDKLVKIPFENFAAQLNRAFADYFPVSCGVKIMAEPGTYFVASAFTLACSIISMKCVPNMNPEKDNTEEEFVYYLNDGIYRSFNFVLNDPSSQYLVLKPAEAVSDGKLYVSTFWGQTCDSVDCVFKRISFPKIAIGDWLYIKNMGSYRGVLTTTFNGFPKPRVYYFIRETVVEQINYKGSLLTEQQVENMKFAISEDSFAEIIPDDFKIRDVVASTAKDLEKQGKDDSFFLGDVGDIFEKFAQFQRYLPNVDPFYAVKSNDSPAVLKILHKLGLGFDCCSEDEMKAVFDIGVTFAAAKNVSLMTFDNSDELYKIKNFYPDAELVIRLQVDDSDATLPLGSKFGVAKTGTKRLLILAKSLGLSVVGVSFHVGCGCKNPLAYYNAVKSARDVFDEAESIGFKLTILDVGGGFPGDKLVKIPFENFAAQLNRAFADYFPVGCGVKIMAEPGTYFVASAFTLACSIIAMKCVPNMNPEKDNTEEEFMYYLNDGTYRSFHFLLIDPFPQYHVLKPVEPINEGKLYPSTFWGQTCDSIDCVFRNIPFPKMSIGDWLYMKDMGAYKGVLTSTFNGFPKPRVHYFIRETIVKQISHIFNGISLESKYALLNVHFNGATRV